MNSIINTIASGLICIGLIVLILKDLLNTKFKVSEKILSGIKVTLLILILIYVNSFLKKFSFIQNIEVSIVAFHTFPIVYILNELITPKIKSTYLLVIGMLLIIPTLIYFGTFYVPDETYSDNGTPNVFIHQRYRNWVCYIGITLFFIGISRVTFNSKKALPS